VNVAEHADATRFRFSVVIPTFQRRDVVATSVAALAAQEEAPAFEVVVVVDGSTDGTAAALRTLDPSFPLTVLEQGNLGRAAACNRGAEAARGELLLFLDDDMEAHPQLLATHDRCHRAGAEVVLGSIPLHPSSPPGFLSAAVGSWADSRARRLARHRRPEAGEILTGQLSIRRDAFLRLGGFDTTFTRDGVFGGEDLDLGRRILAAGLDVRFEPEAVSWQRYVVTPRQYLRQWRQAGRASVLLARKHPGHSASAFYRQERRVDRLLWRPLRRPLRALVLAAAAAAPRSERVGRWFFRVRDLEYFQGVRAAGGAPHRGTIRVLCYHAIADLEGAPVLEEYGVPPEEFARQLRILTRHFHPIDGDELARFLQGAGVPRRAVLVTFDDCYRDLYDSGLPLLRRRHVAALAFAVSGAVGGMNAWDEHLGAVQLELLDASPLKALTEEGIEIGVHSRTHRRLDRLPPAELRDEVEGSAADLEALGLGRPRFLAYPHGAWNEDARNAAIAAGLVAAFTVNPGSVRPGSDPYALPRIEIFRADSGWKFLWKVARAGRPLRPRSLRLR